MVITRSKDWQSTSPRRAWARRSAPRATSTKATMLNAPKPPTAPGSGRPPTCSEMASMIRPNRMGSAMVTIASTMLAAQIKPTLLAIGGKIAEGSPINLQQATLWYPMSPVNPFIVHRTMADTVSTTVPQDNAHDSCFSSQISNKRWLRPVIWCDRYNGLRTNEKMAVLRRNDGGHAAGTTCAVPPMPYPGMRIVTSISPPSRMVERCVLALDAIDLGLRSLSGFVFDHTQPVDGSAQIAALPNSLPNGWDGRRNDDSVATPAYAEDGLDGGPIEPAGRTGVPGPAAASRLDGVGIDIGRHDIGLDPIDARRPSRRAHD